MLERFITMRIDCEHGGVSAMRRWSKTGFTMAELLVVVAIIAVLVAVAIPVFSGQLEKSRESVDAANIRSSYAELMAAVISDDKSSPLWKADSSSWKTEPIELRQQKSGWNTASIEEALKTFATVAGTITVPQAGGTAWLEYKGTQLALYYGQGSTEPTLTPAQQTKQVLETVLSQTLTTDNTSQTGEMSIGKMIVSGKEADLIKELVAAGVKGAVKLTNDNNMEYYGSNVIAASGISSSSVKLVTVALDNQGQTGHKQGDVFPAIQYLYYQTKAGMVLFGTRETDIKVKELKKDGTINKMEFDRSDVNTGSTWTRP